MEKNPLSLSVIRVLTKTPSYISRVMPAAVVFLLLTSNLLLLTSYFPSAFAEEAPSPLEKGIQLLNENRLDEALKIFQEASTLNPSDPLPYYYLGVVYHKKRELAPAINALNKALNIQPNMPLSLLRIGIVLEDAGSIDMALSAYKALTDTNEDIEPVKEAKKRFNDLIYKRAGRFFQEKQYEKAIADLKTVVSITPDNADAWFAMGLSYQRLRRLKDAAGALKKVVEINPSHVNAYMQLGLINEFLSAYEDAISAFQKVVELSPGTSMAADAEKKILENKKKLETRGLFEVSAKLIKDEKWQEALETTIKILALEPSNPNVLVSLGTIHYNLKEPAIAIDYLKKAIEIDQKVQKAHYQLAVIYDDSKKYKDAYQSYKTVVSISDKTPDAKKARERLGMLSPFVEFEEKMTEVKELATKEDLAGTIRQMEELVQAKKDDPKLLLTLSTLYLSAERRKDAATVLQKVLVLTPKDTRTRILLANIYEELKEYKNAAEGYKLIASLEEGTDIAKDADNRAKRLMKSFHLAEGKSYLTQGNYEAALKEMEAVLDISPDEPLALFNAGVLNIRLNRLEAAEVPLKKAITIVPDYVQAYLQLGVLYERLRRFEDAREAFEKIVDIQKDGKEAQIAKARIVSLKESEALTKHIKEGIRLMEAKDWDGARIQIGDMLKIYPNNYIGYYYMGMILDGSGIIDEAIAAFKKAIEINPGFLQTYLRLGDLYVKEYEYEEARRVFQQVVTVNKDSPEAEIASERIKLLKSWYLSLDMNHGYSSNIAFRSKAIASASSTYGLGLTYLLIREKTWNASFLWSGRESLYYDSQLVSNGYSMSLSASRSFSGDYNLSGNGSLNKSFFEGKLTYSSTSYSLTASTSPRTIPTSASLSYNFSRGIPVDKRNSSETHSISASISQKLSVKDSVSGSYGFSIYKNLHPMGSNYASRTNSLSFSYSRPIFSALSFNLGYSISFVDYSNPDSTTLFQRYRKNTNKSITSGLSLSFSEDVAVSFNYNFSYAISKTNLSPLTYEEQQQLEELLSYPIPTVGGGGGYYQHSLGVSLRTTF